MGPPGHLAVGFAAKRFAPRTPLWLLLSAAMAADILFYVFMALGMESEGIKTTDLQNGVVIVSPGSLAWSHGLLMSIVWMLLVGSIVLLVLHEWRIGIVVGLVVFSHWVLDFIVHVPDLPLLFDGSALVGLGMWGSGPGLIMSAVLEFALLAGGIAIYRADRKRRRTAESREQAD